MITINPLKPYFYYLTDHLGSNSYITNDVGQITQTLAYLPFDEVVAVFDGSRDEKLGKGNNLFGERAALAKATVYGTSGAEDIKEYRAESSGSWIIQNERSNTFYHTHNHSKGNSEPSHDDTNVRDNVLKINPKAKIEVYSNRYYIDYTKDPDGGSSKYPVRPAERR